MAVGAVDISVFGDKKLMKMFNRLPGKLQKKIARPALRKAAKPIHQAAKAKAPKDTGMLRRGIKIRAVKRSRKVIGVLVRTESREFFGIPADSKWYYPAHVELGYVRGGKTVPGVRYLRDAFDAKESQSLGIVKREIGDGIVREAKKGK